MCLEFYNIHLIYLQSELYISEVYITLKLVLRKGNFNSRIMKNTECRAYWTDTYKK